MGDEETRKGYVSENYIFQTMENILDYNNKLYVVNKIITKYLKTDK